MEYPIFFFLHFEASQYADCVETLTLNPNSPILMSQVLRAFRVLRLFGRLKSLRNIVAAISASIIPVLNAFVIIYLVASICLSTTRPLFY